MFFYNLDGDKIYAQGHDWAGKLGIAFGTSITDKSDKIIEGYISMVKAKTGLSVYTNSGLDGNPMAIGTANGDGIGNLIEATDISGYDLVTIEACTNDFKLNVPLGTVGAIGDSEFDKATFCGSLRSAIEYIRANNPTCQIVLITDPQRDNSGYTVNSINTAGHKMADYVDAMISIGKLYAILVADCYNECGITELNLDTTTSDGLHPTTIGYKMMASCIMRALSGAAPIE